MLPRGRPREQSCPECSGPVPTPISSCGTKPVIFRPAMRVLARRLAYDTLRNLLRIDRTISSVSARGLSSIDDGVLDTLRVGVNELLFAATADHAAVDSAVEVARSIQRSATGFCNAVLRAVIREGEPDLPPGDDGSALRLGQPLWVYQLMVETWGRPEAEAFFDKSQSEAARTARLRYGQASDDAAQVAGINGVYELPPDTPLPENMMIQDGASVAVGLALDAQPGERVLDLAAAPGGKTLQILDQMHGRGLVVAADGHPRRVRSAARRSQDTPVRWCVADGRQAPFRSDSFDRVLVDAPCTGLGTLRRRPEVRYRIEEADVLALASLQERMLVEALRVVKPGGRVVYSVCTVTPQETVGVVEGLTTEPVVTLPGRAWNDGWLLGPHLTGTDGMFITSIKG